MKLQNETISPCADPVSARPHGKWYNDACGTAFALELVGERWALLIVRELMFGARRFSDLRAGAAGISAKTLTERLEGLERAGVVQRRQMPPPASTHVYELTPWGYAADEAIMALGRWAASSPAHDPTLPLSPASFMLSLRTMFDAHKAQPLAIAGGFCIGGERFVAKIDSGAFVAARDDFGAESPDFTITAPTANPIAFAVYGKMAFAELADMGLVFSGDRAAAGAFIGCFDLPEKFA